MEIDSVKAAAKPAASRTGFEPPPAMTPRMIPRMLTRPSWPPKITSRSQLVWRCSSRCFDLAVPAGVPAVRTTRPSRVCAGLRPELSFIGDTSHVIRGPGEDDPAALRRGGEAGGRHRELPPASMAMAIGSRAVPDYSGQ